MNARGNKSAVNSVPILHRGHYGPESSSARPDARRCRMKTLSCAAAAAALVALVSSSVGAQMNGMSAPMSNMDVRVNGQSVTFQDAQPRMFYGHVMVPLSDVVNRLGATTKWNARTRTVMVMRSGIVARIPIGGRIARVNGRDIWMDVPAMTVSGHTMAPLQFFSDVFGATVTWNNATGAVTINTTGGTAQQGPRAASLEDTTDQTTVPSSGGTDRRDNRQYLNALRAG